MFGLSVAAKAPSTTYNSIDFAIYIDVATLQIYENGGCTRLKLIYPSPFILSVEKVPLPPQASFVLIVVRVLPLSVIFTNALLSLSLLGVNSPPVVVAATTSSVPLYMDTAFFSAGGRLDEVTMLNAPVTSVPRTATYKIDYRNNNE
jgi:hypothetical protein